MSDADLVHPLNPDSPHAAAAIAARTRIRFFLVDLIGCPADQVAALIASSVDAFEEQSLVPVFVTDLLDFTAFREAGVVFEAVSPLGPSADLAPELDWQRWRTVELAAIEAKWQPVGQTSLGDGGLAPAV